jgi:ribose transport system ATP-binding protein
MKTLLEVKNITKKFSGVTALRDVNLKLVPGKVLALIGENGAGKSTLLKIMSGIHKEYEGTIVYKDQSVQFSNPKDAQDLGISIIHQELNLIPHLTVTQNIFLGRELTNRLGIFERDKMNRKTKELLLSLKLDVDPSTMVSSLKVGQQQIVEIAKALLTNSAVVFMDEPTSALGENEAEILFQIIDQLRSDGKVIVYISHKLDELFTIADDFVVLRDGELVGQGSIDSISRDELINMMAGREVTINKKEKRKSSDDYILRVRDMSLQNPENPDRPILQNINFEVYRGEILGIYGLMGAGRTELCETLFGLNKSSGGTIVLDGKQITCRNPGHAIDAGIVLVPEDRKQDGIFAGLSVAKNISLTVLDKVSKLGLLNKKKESQLYDKHVDTLNIRVQSESQLIKTLSGGNQQKVVLAKWIERDPKLLILDEPTRGIDVNAKNEIYELISNLANSGISIIVVSSEIPEILSVSDRVLVMSEGQITASFTSEEANENNLMKACIPENLTV